MVKIKGKAYSQLGSLNILDELRVRGIALRPQSQTTVDAGDTAFTTTGDEIVTCLNTALLTVTLNATPEDLEHVTIARRDGAVTITGTVNGGSSTQLLAQYDTADLIFSAAAAEWMIA